jgi:hypothetical protein
MDAFLASYGMAQKGAGDGRTKSLLIEPLSQEETMRYYVTFDHSGLGALDEGSSEPLELADARNHACRLLDEGKQNVVIRNDANQTISGADLLACCKGDKEITPDLRAVDIRE